MLVYLYMLQKLLFFICLSSGVMMENFGSKTSEHVSEKCIHQIFASDVKEEH